MRKIFLISSRDNQRFLRSDLPLSHTHTQTRERYTVMDILRQTQAATNTPPTDRHSDRQTLPEIEKDRQKPTHIKTDTHPYRPTLTHIVTQIKRTHNDSHRNTHTHTHIHSHKPRYANRTAPRTGHGMTSIVIRARRIVIDCSRIVVVLRRIVRQYDSCCTASSSIY